ncbi:hypothetical protein RRG08_036313 [Elysia crispata]|uniref:Uncharacterized protein n=1 Tax=Elysia crispata TaxID=231223 RepID=A0AAE1DJG6_9GAST|nr:hypothetical protein RRG08_036313 [Elysia crispata]
MESIKERMRKRGSGFMEGGYKKKKHKRIYGKDSLREKRKIVSTVEDNETVVENTCLRFHVKRDSGSDRGTLNDVNLLSFSGPKGSIMEQRLGFIIKSNVLAVMNITLGTLRVIIYLIGNMFIIGSLGTVRAEVSLRTVIEPSSSFHSR